MNWESGEWVSLGSTALSAARWDATAGTLTIEFPNGYQYAFDVDRAKAEAFFDAPSQGTFWREELKGRYGERRVG